MTRYDHGLTNKIPKALDREENERLYHRVMAGDREARRQMIEGNRPLVVMKVDSYIHCYPNVAYLRDDLHSAGFAALVQAVNKMAEHDQPRKVNPTGYISVAITHGIARLAEKEAAMGLTSIPEFEDAPDDDDDAPRAEHNVPDSILDANESARQGLFELRDLIHSCCQSEEEHTLVRMREEGYSDREIARALNMSHTSAYMLRKELETRFQEKCRELEE